MSKLNIDLDDKACKKLADDVFELIKKANSVEDLYLAASLKNGERILTQMPGKEFPRLELKLMKDELDELIEKGILEPDGTLSPSLASGFSRNMNKLSALEKLLYVMLWKNGDLGKERHIVAGVLNRNTNEANAVVFRSFGGYLAGRVPFILDQHTLRAFAVYRDSIDLTSINREIDVVNRGKHLDHINAYQEFFQKLSESEYKPDLRSFLYEVDRLLFAVGKIIKVPRAKRIRGKNKV